MIIVPMHPTKYPEFTCKYLIVNERDLIHISDELTKAIGIARIPVPNDPFRRWKSVSQLLI